MGCGCARGGGGEGEDWGRLGRGGAGGEGGGAWGRGRFEGQKGKRGGGGGWAGKNMGAGGGGARRRSWRSWAKRDRGEKVEGAVGWAALMGQREKRRGEMAGLERYLGWFERGRKRERFDFVELYILKC